jgi:hypothetical protein
MIPGESPPTRTELENRISHYGVTGSMRYSWVRLSLFDEL